MSRIGRVAYESWKPSASSITLITIANDICAEYEAQGFDLTLRQLYYQFVARGHIPNNQRSYKMLGNIVDKARRAGLMDWDYIVDRTRNLAGNRLFDDPADLIEDAAKRYFIDLWDQQEVRIVGWVEKEALAGVVRRAALSRGVNYSSCRGYVSQSEMHSAALRHRYYEQQGQDVVIIHLGDHDPSGIDMTRDIQARLNLFGANTFVNRIALTFDQVLRYGPPPNPAKTTDARYETYRDQFGEESWELDALDPNTLNELIVGEIDTYMDFDRYNDRVEQQDRGRDQLVAVSNRWGEIEQLVEEDFEE